MSRVLIKPVEEVSARTCPRCATLMTRMDEHTVSEQYTRQTWWKCTECKRSRYFQS